MVKKGHSLAAMLLWIKLQLDECWGSKLQKTELVVRLFAEHEIIQFAPYIDKFRYRKNLDITVGAAVGFTAEQYKKVNGYSNEYEVSYSYS